VKKVSRKSTLAFTAKKKFKG